MNASWGHSCRFFPKFSLLQYLIIKWLLSENRHWVHIVVTPLAFIGTPVNRSSFEDYSSPDPSEFFPIIEENASRLPCPFTSTWKTICHIYIYIYILRNIHIHLYWGRGLDRDLFIFKYLDLDTFGLLICAFEGITVLYLCIRLFGYLKPVR